MYVLTDDIREIIKKPLGTLISADKISLYLTMDDLIATCGDITTKTVYDLGYRMKIAIIDNKTKREKVVNTINMDGYDIKKVISIPGTVSDDLFLAVKEAVISDHNILIKVIGEEDLGTLPLINYMPCNSKILYGQPDEGIVVVYVNEKIKEYVKNMLLKMVRI